MKQAQEIRSNIMDSFETAAIPGQTDDEMKRLLNFVVVGGGPTGTLLIYFLCVFSTKKYSKNMTVTTQTYNEKK